MVEREKDLFFHFSSTLELNKSEQQAYLSSLKLEHPELAEQLAKMLDSKSDLTQFFSESFQAITTESQGASVGDMLNQFKLTQSLGNGGMGQVFKAERCDGKIEQTVAIKFLHPLLYQYQSGQLLLQEAQALAQLNHPNIATVFDIAETKLNAPYIVMEYVDGVTLDKYLAKNQLSIDEKLTLFIQIADAVLEAHNHQIIHADIKPSNILITSSGQAKLIDFGIMQLAGELALNAPKIVTHYLCAMTVNYASPEQLNGSKATIRSDIYGLGGLLFFILSGHSPFEDVGGSLHEKITHISNNIAPQCTVPEKVKFKSDLLAILAKALAKQPNDRYRTVTDLINDIHAFQQYRPVTINSNLKLHNATKFLYRNRYLTATVTFIFLIISVSLFQLQMKNEQIEKEKQQLANVSEELKRTYSQRDKSLADAQLENEAIYLPNPEKVSSDQYIELMLLLFDNHFRDGRKQSYLQVIGELYNWQKHVKIKTLDKLLIQYRYELATYSQKKTDVGANKLEAALKKILNLEGTYDPRIIDIFFFLNHEEYSKGNHFSQILNRLENELEIETLSTQRKLAFLFAKGVITKTHESNYSKAAEYLERALTLARNNPELINVKKYLDVINILLETYNDWYGPYNRKTKLLTNEYRELSLKLDVNSELYLDTLGSILQKQFKYSMSEVEKTLSPLQLTLERVNTSDNHNEAHIFRFYGFYLNTLGRFKEAEEVFRKASELVSKVNGVQSKYYIYYIETLAGSYLDQGKIELGLNLYENIILPYAKKYQSLDYLGYFKTNLCVRLSKSGKHKKLEQYCQEAYQNTYNSLGNDNFWTHDSLNALVLLLSLQKAQNDELAYVQNLESSLSDLSHKDTIKRTESLICYYLSRNNSVKTQSLLSKHKQSLDGYYESVDTIKYFYHKMMEAELAILQNNTQLAVDRLTEIKDRLCALGNQNPHRIKYIELTNSLNMKTCNVT